MRGWRITDPRLALDKLCQGTAQYGGRWNPAGMPALYCGAGVAIASLEKFVHLGAAPWPDLVLVAVDLPPASRIDAPPLADLPPGWNDMPASGAAQAFGAQWLASRSALALRVPSPIVPEEFNFVLNPSHPDYVHVMLTVVRPFIYDGRMAKPKVSRRLTD
jgi:RES domain-containing protein